MSQTSLPDPLNNALSKDVPVEEIIPNFEAWSGDDLKHGFPTRLIPLRIHTHPDERFYITITGILEETNLEPDHWLHIVPESRNLYESAAAVDGDAGIPDAEVDDDEMLLCQRVKEYRHKDPDSRQESKSIKQPVDNSGSIRLYFQEALLEEAFGFTLASYPESNPLLFEPIYEEGAEVFGLDPIGYAGDLCRNAETAGLPFSTAFAELVGRAVDADHHNIIHWTSRLADTLTPTTFAAAGIEQAAPPRFVETAGTRYGIYFYPVGAFKDVTARFFGTDPQVARGVWVIHSKVAMSLIARLYSETGDTDAVPEDDPTQDERFETVVMPLPDE